MQTNTDTNKHYLDYYSDWLLALKKASLLTDMKDVQIKASAFVGILNELVAAERINTDRASAYILEVNVRTWEKFAAFNN